MEEKKNGAWYVMEWNKNGEYVNCIRNEDIINYNNGLWYFRNGIFFFFVEM